MLLTKPALGFQWIDKKSTNRWHLPILHVLDHLLPCYTQPLVSTLSKEAILGIRTYVPG